jgi:hypothetical protein
VNPLEKACALLEAATGADLQRLCGAERLMLSRQLQRWDRLLIATAPKAEPRSGVLGDLKGGRGRE